uniref:Dynein heavy chain n=1 Tax=Micromonas pusilla TaxID=38833 RepID=A0A7S0GLB7_MICPS|mmetsp:Transcript_11630/g.49649  ORF Transcript_11630/g.49649 Transcript_11630/m.49649 type:complete len:4502 (+) Transcript_11630:193-13698(+)
MADPRHEYIAGKVAQSFGIPPEEAEQGLQTHDAAVRRFYEPDGPKTLLLYYQSEAADAPRTQSTSSVSTDAATRNSSSAPKRLVVTDGANAALDPTSHALYFIRVNSKGVGEKGCEQDVAAGEIRGGALESFRALISNLYAPVLKSQHSATWGKAREESAKEFVRGVAKFGATLAEAAHSLQGGVELARPPQKYAGMEIRASAFADAATDKAVCGDMERVLEDWCDATEALLDSGLTEEASSGGRRDSEEMGPDTELEYWRSRMAKFNSVMEQLKSRECRCVLGVCGAARSAAHKRWKLIDMRVTDAANESKDNVKYLTTLEKALEPMYVGDVRKILDGVPALMNSVKMMYAVCRYFHQRERMTRLFHKITNRMIFVCKEFLNEPGTLWNQPKDTLLANLKLVVELRDRYRAEYSATKKKLRENPSNRQFDFDEERAFGKFDLFAKRLHKLVDMFTTIVQFTQLAERRMDGMEGVIRRFFVVAEEFKRKPYDLLDFSKNQYDRDFLEFNVNIHDLETKLQTFIDSSFENISSTEQALNMLRQFQSVLKRDSLKKDLDDKYVVIFQNYALDLDAVQKIYEKHKHSPATPRNAPPVAGDIMWSRQLLRRIEEPMRKFAANEMIMRTKESKRTVKTYNTVAKALVAFETLWLRAWRKSIEDSKAGLQATLIVRHPETGNLLVNFDKEIMQLMRETKYLQRMGVEVPESAKMVLLQEEKFKHYYNQLSYALREYDRVVATAAPVCLEMLGPHLRDLENRLRPGMYSLTWTSMNIDGYLNRIHDGLARVEELIAKMNDVLENRVEANLKHVARTLFVNLPAEQSYTYEEFLSTQARYIKKQTEQIAVRNVEIERGVRDLCDLVLNAPRENAEEVLDQTAVDEFTAHYAKLMYQAILTATRASFLAMKKRLGSRSSGGFLYIERPIFGVDVELTVPKVSMNPSLEEIQGAINSTAKKILRASESLRMWGAAGQSVENFYHWIASDKEIVKSVLLLTGSVEGTKAQVMEYIDTFKKFDFLYLTDLQSEYAAFMATEPSLEAFENELKKYMAVEEEIAKIAPVHNIGAMSLETQPMKNSLKSEAATWKTQFAKNLHTQGLERLRAIHDYMRETTLKLNRAIEDLEDVRVAMGVLREIRDREAEIDAILTPIEDIYALLSRYQVRVPKEETDTVSELRFGWGKMKTLAISVNDNLSRLQVGFKRDLIKEVKAFVVDAAEFREDWDANGPAVPGLDPVEAVDRLKKFTQMFEVRARKWRNYCSGEELFGLTVTNYPEMEKTEKEIGMLTRLYDLYTNVLSTIDNYADILWTDVVANIDQMSEQVSQFQAQCKKLPKALRDWPAYTDCRKKIDDFLEILPLLQALSSPDMRERHWAELGKITGVEFNLAEDTFKLQDLLGANMLRATEEIEDLTTGAIKEAQVETKLGLIDEDWADQEFAFGPYKNRGNVVLSMAPTAELIEKLEDAQMALGSMATNRYSAPFKEEVAGWIAKLSTVSEIVEGWLIVQNMWMYMEAVFSGGDIVKQLPLEAKRFNNIDKTFMKAVAGAVDEANVVAVCCGSETMLNTLPHLTEQLELCQKSLTAFLDTKRAEFPRFYFVSDPTLLEILSLGSDPQAVTPHFQSGLFDSLTEVTFDKVDKTKMLEMFSQQNECVKFVKEVDGLLEPNPVMAVGNIEVWLQSLVDGMQMAIRSIIKMANSAVFEQELEQFIFGHPAQISLLGVQFLWTADMQGALTIARKDKTAMSKANKKADALLKEMITITQRPTLGKNERKNLETVITVHVHQRDTSDELTKKRVRDPSDFEWMKQCRFYWRDELNTVIISICDVDFEYSYEYLGVKERLVITPLTDICYVTLSQALGMFLGGAPAGPAGTGKTETTKDLGNTLGKFVVVFNCSDQMDYKAMGMTYKGLAQTGAWGCFDEFNRIPVSVLSVCSTQYKTVLDAIRARKQKFMFEDVEISLRPSIMAFITMNPGYPGRAELPESLKALFRPVSMCVPDLQMICENMLMGEGFYMSKILARKFVILYKLCEDLLSKAPHYDWKLRAIKTTLYVAGGMKRDQPELSEDKVLLQALRDFNLGKLTADDHGIFMGLLNDLFPKMLDLVPRLRDLTFEEQIVKSAVELGYQPEDKFVLKITQLREIFTVRWSVFLLGPAGCGKTAVWKTLLNAQNKSGEKSRSIPINPKAVTRNELYGFLHPSTREWKEGLMSVNFRDMSNNKTYQHQWIVLDGDIDAEWIESMNTVMDDNKMLTLASNERLPLTGTMRLLLEINHMLHCSPATVSRGGVIYLNQDDIGWQPMVESWIQSREAKEYRPLLVELFDRYMEKSLEHCRRNFRTIVPLVPMNIAGTVCKILEGLIPSEQVRGAPPPEKKIVEMQFVYAAVWALGGAMLVDKTVDYRAQFSKWWLSEWKNVLFPEGGLVFDYYVDDATGQMAPWTDRVDSFGYNASEAFANIFVPSVESTRLSFLLDGFIANKHYCMFVGNAGTGKTALMKESLKNLDGEAWTFSTVNMNNFMDAPALQVIIEQPLEKKSGVRFGPPGSKKLVYFFDDMNMPFVDKYDTQSPIELARQFVDYHGWYDKNKIVLKEIKNSQYMACMNPTAGSFNITPRMQRHFVTLAVQMPGKDVIRSVFAQIIEGHLSSFDPDVGKYGSKITDALIELHGSVANTFLPSAVKFHYQWNLRELSNVTQGICRALPEFYANPVTLCRLWIHEVERVFSDRMVHQTDIAKFDEMRVAVTKKYFADENQEEVEQRPISYNAFMKFDSNDEGAFCECATYEKLNKTLVEKLNEHNESNAVMDLVLFEQAMDHVTRVTRILDLPRGNAMLVGVGGSGKQSLAKLATFICQYDVFQISVTSSYGMADFKADLLSLYIKAGVKGNPVTFLMTDGQIIDERFLVYINDLLSSGYIPDLMTNEEKDEMCNAVRNECKGAGIIDSPENLWDFFLDKVRKYLHVCLCFSPVGDKFRIRARNFPALINCTVIDWFQPWPHEALVSVAGRFLAEIPDIEPELLENLQFHCAFTHTAVNDASIKYLEEDRRYNYTTPKSYLELISLYKDMLAAKRSELKQAKERLENGVDKIAQASAQVADLQVNLKEEQIIVEEKKANTDALIVSIGKEKAIVDEAVESASGDEAECAQIAEEVSAFQAECEEDLKAAEPIIQAAEAALNSLDKKALGELKSLSTPPAGVDDVASACMILCAPKGKIPKDISWNACKKFMGSVDKFLSDLINFDKDNTPLNCVEKVEKDYLGKENFNPEIIMGKSSAAAGLCSWVINICKYFRIYQVVAPKRKLLAEANEKLDAANTKLSGIRAKVAELQARVASLEENLMAATEDKNNAIAAAEKTQAKANLADRLVNGLSGENKRWGEAIEAFGVAEAKLVGDVLVGSSFVSYAGPFNTKFREFLVNEKWLPDMIERAIPMTQGVTPLDVLSNPGMRAAWGIEGLPTDPLSVENGAIMTSAARWALMIDPQLQGIKWIKEKWGDKLKIIQLSKPNYIADVEHCIENGVPLMIENLQDDIDAVLDPVVARQTIKRGRNVVMKLGDSEVDYDPNFKLYLQTKLSNPHYKPEIAAQTTLVNFCVTEKGLEDQLLALVVEKERFDLQQQSSDLVRQLGEYTVQITKLEDNLLFRLANSQGDILEDIELIENLEETKRTATEIAEKVVQATETQTVINSTREVYRPVAARGALMYFLVDALNVLDRVYQYSMANFVYILKKGMDVTPGGTDQSKVAEHLRTSEPLSVEKRVEKLIETTSETVFGYIASGLFERHKLIVASQLTMSVLRKQDKLQQGKFEWLLKGPRVLGVENPLPEWIAQPNWECVQSLTEVDGYDALPGDLEGSAKRWREWMELERPEEEPMPGDWKKYPDFEKLLLFRALRPDRMSNALSTFVKSVLGSFYVTSAPFDLASSFEDSSPGTPIFIFLSPGVDVAAAVESLGTKLGYTSENGRYAAVSLGQGQEPIAMSWLTNFHKNGGWVLLQNIHLTIDWTNGPLEKTVDKLAEGAHAEFRLFLSAEPPPILERGLAISLLQNSIKLTNEPPEGMKQNLARAYGNFNEEMFEACAKQAEFKTIVFALCYFHAAILERKKFGVGNMPDAASGIGWNMNYPFNTGDLLCCGQCVNNYLENNSNVPWADLKYIIGEIMYGGHVVEDWDRRTVEKYLDHYFKEELLEGIDFFPKFPSPPSSLNHKQTMEYIAETFPTESPLAFGLHPNAEIGFKLREAESLCSSILSLQPRDGSGEEGSSVEDQAKMVLDDLVERLPDQFDLEDIRSRTDDITPYIMVAIQETERMNKLLAEMKRSLAELDLGLKGDLTMSDPMEALMNALADGAVSAGWTKLAYPSLRGLGSWMVNLLQRVEQLQMWTADLATPRVVWLSGLFNPQSFLTAVMQTTARRNDWPLDKTVVLTEVTKKNVEQIESASREGAYVHGLTLEGCRFDEKVGVLEDSRPKEMFCPMPVIVIKAVTADKAEQRDAYQCPVYKTERRFREEVFTAQLKSKHGQIKWTLCGVCLFLDVV